MLNAKPKKGTYRAQRGGARNRRRQEKLNPAQEAPGHKSPAQEAPRIQNPAQEAPRAQSPEGHVAKQNRPEGTSLRHKILEGYGGNGFVYVLCRQNWPVRSVPPPVTAIRGLAPNLHFQVQKSRSGAIFWSPDFF